MRLIDVDALKATHNMGDFCDNCPDNWYDCKYRMDYTKKDICDLIDDAPTVCKWISVKERLPDIPAGQKHSETVLVAVVYYGKQWVSIDEYCEDGTWACNGVQMDDASDIAKVTHWMPMLPLPERKGDDGNVA